jgi:deoxycitidine kinase/deoxyguanosine kinase
MTTILISIEGNIGTGKTTLLDHLKDHYKDDIKIGYLAEPVDVWNTIKDKAGYTILEKYYSDQTKYAFAFQMMAYISRLSVLKAALQEKKYNIIITERSLFTDSQVFAKMLYDTQRIEEVEYLIYNKWFNEFMADLPPINYIYLQADPASSFARVNKRGRVGENIPLSYLETCHQYHERWLLPYTKFCRKILVLDATGDIADILPAWFIAIDRFIAIHRIKISAVRDINTVETVNEHRHIMNSGI